MLTLDALIEYSAQTGLLINPEKDIETFIEIVNQKEGRCPCDEYRICPCPEARNEAVNGADPKKMCCMCQLFVTHEYVNAWGLHVPKPEPAPKKRKETTPEPEFEWEIKTPKIKELMKTVETAERLVRKRRPDEAKKVLQDQIDSSDCAMCQELLGTETLRMQYLEKVCQRSDDTCGREIKSAEAQFEDIKTLLRQTDEYSVQGTVDGKPIHGEENGEEKPQDEFHACMKTLAELEIETGAIPEKINQVKLYIRSKICSKGVADESEALLLCREDHPEWFTREVI